MSQTIRRTLRTFLVVALAIAGVIPLAADQAGVPADDAARVAGLILATVTILTAAVNAWEDSGRNVPGFPNRD